MLRRSIRTSVATALLVALVSLLVGPGCGNLCDRDPNEPPVPYKGGNSANVGTASAWYETSAFTGPYLDFPPGRTYRITHGLGACPAHIEGWLAFGENPVSDSNKSGTPSGTAPAAGNQFTVERVTPDTIDVRNDTCSDVHVRVFLSDPDPSGHSCQGAPADGGTASSTLPDATSP